MHKILIAEDDDLLRRMYQRIFIHAGYEVEIAENGEDAFKKIATFNPQLLITDIMMPKLTGLELLEKIKNDSNFANIKVVVLTNLKKKEEIEKALLNGAAEYIIKDDHHPQKV